MAADAPSFIPWIRVRELQQRLNAFMQQHIYPNERRYFDEAEHPGPCEVDPVIAETIGASARAMKPFVPRKYDASGLSNLEYAPLCETMGRSLLAPEVFNCSASDTDNMQTLMHYGTAEQRAQRLPKLLAGEIRSCFAMTEPDVASSDATNVQATIVKSGDEYVINGRKWYTVGATDTRCRIAIFMDNRSWKSRPTQAAVDDPRAHGRTGRRGAATDRRVRLLRRSGPVHRSIQDVRVPRRTCCGAKGGAGLEIAQGAWDQTAFTTA